MMKNYGNFQNVHEHFFFFFENRWKTHQLTLVCPSNEQFSTNTKACLIAKVFMLSQGKSKFQWKLIGTSTIQFSLSILVDSTTFPSLVQSTLGSKTLRLEKLETVLKNIQSIKSFSTQ